MISSLVTLVVLGGVDATFCSQAMASPWTMTGSLNVPRVDHTATLLPDGRVLVAGGQVRSDGGTFHATATAELFNPATETWTATGSMSRPRVFHTAILLPNGTVLVVGGVPADVEVYDPATGRWDRSAFLHFTRRSPTATLLADGRVLIAGGVGLNGGLVRSAEVYDPLFKVSIPTGDLNVARGGHQAVRLKDGRVLVVGGAVNTNLGSTRDGEVYDPATGAWVHETGLLRDRDGFQFTATLIPEALHDGYVLIVGGFDQPLFLGPNAAIDDVEAYVPHFGFHWIGRLNVARNGHTALYLGDGKVMVTGGVDEAKFELPQTRAPGVLKSTEIYDAATWTWTPTHDLNVRRFGHTMTLLLNGKVLVAGGINLDTEGSGPLGSAELYPFRDPAPSWEWER